MSDALNNNLLGGMKMALMRGVLAEPNPTVQKLNSVLLEEFGEPASPQMIAAFKQELAKRQPQAPKAQAAPKPPPEATAPAPAKKSPKARIRPQSKSHLEIVREVVAEPEPSLEKLNQAFQKELGMQTPAAIKTVFKMELDKKSAAEEGISLAQLLMRKAQKRKKF